MTRSDSIGRDQMLLEAHGRGGGEHRSDALAFDRGMHRDTGSTSVVCLSTLEFYPGSGPTSGSVPPSCDGPITSQRLFADGRGCKMSRPVSVRVLFNLRNCQ